MSQTLSLPPGKYSLFIAPPVAGVDFTGTPTPSVSYQWRKNGTAVSGQTAATITGVWVGQTGGTVDLADGDTISIDIILTNPVSVVVKTVSAVIDASIPAPVITPISIRLVSAPTTPVSTIPNDSIGSQIMVASSGSVNVVTTPPLLPSFQWRRGFAPIAGATSHKYTLQAADADSIIDCVVSVTNSGGTTTRTAASTVGTLPAAGWTELTPSADSRLIYVSADGDDVAAASVKGRGYYLSGDPEIGADPTNPVGPIVAYRSSVEAVKRVRLSRCIGQDANGLPTYGTGGPGGFPDWLLLRRGQVIGDTMLLRNPYDNNDYNYSFQGMLASIGNPNYGWRQDVGNLGTGTGDHCGRSASEPAVVTAWGNPADSRPSLPGSFYIGGRARHLRVVSLNFPSLNWGWTSEGSPAGDVVVEDCKMRHIGPPTNMVSTYDRGVLVRRCVVSGNHKTINNEGWFVGQDGARIAIEECVFDKNGYREDPFDATKWTAGVVSPLSGQQFAPGTGVQPQRNYRDRNLYLSWYESMALRGNIISRGGGGYSVQMRGGGISERNLFIWNESALGMSHPQSDPSKHLGSLVTDNVVLHDDCFLPPGGWGGGLTAGGASNDVAVLDGNVVAHFHRSVNGTESIGLIGKKAYYEDGVRVYPASQLLRGVVKDNAIYRKFKGVGIMVADDLNENGVLEAEVTGNQVSTAGAPVSVPNEALSFLSMQGSSAKPEAFTYSGNKFHASVPGGAFRWGWHNGGNDDYRFGATDGSFAQWQAAGFDSDATLTTDFAAFTTAAGWTDPERDIVSYMESVDQTYVVNEDVYVDEDATIKQANRQKVWEALMTGTGIAAMTEAQAKLAARRYHAFITFIQRAKENRKGAWDPRWTAEAVNNYIRAGFGKPAVTGAYDTRSLADRLSDYTI